jgi:hypothetical protein
MEPIYTLIQDPPFIKVHSDSEGSPIEIEGWEEFDRWASFQHPLWNYCASICQGNHYSEPLKYKLIARALLLELSELHKGLYKNPKEPPIVCKMTCHKPLNCQGINIPDSSVMIGKSDTI